jgi:hypothetical protein
LIGTMFNKKTATGKAKPALNLATASVWEGLHAPRKLAPSVSRLGVVETLRELSNSSFPKRADNIGAPQ